MAKGPESSSWLSLSLLFWGKNLAVYTEQVLGRGDSQPSLPRLGDSVSICGSQGGLLRTSFHILRLEVTGTDCCDCYLGTNDLIAHMHACIHTTHTHARAHACTRAHTHIDTCIQMYNVQNGASFLISPPIPHDSLPTCPYEYTNPSPKAIFFP